MAWGLIRLASLFLPARLIGEEAVARAPEKNRVLVIRVDRVARGLERLRVTGRIRNCSHDSFDVLLNGFDVLVKVLHVGIRVHIGFFGAILAGSTAFALLLKPYF